MKNPPHHLISLVLSFSAACLPLSAENTQRPNIILAMADDMGWGDPGYNSMVVTLPDGTPHPDQGWIQTPVMDEMAANGLKFNRFYSASAVCSPTRASCLTGRNPYRVGVPTANQGRLGFDETPLSEILAAEGYNCGHFGKWHLGAMTTLRSDSNRGPSVSAYSAPWHHRYDYCFATEAKTPTYHPYRITNNSAALPTSFADSNFYGTHYWRMPATFSETSGEGVPVPVEEVNNAMNGDDSKLIVDQAISYIQATVAEGKPFFVVLWFHTPHKPTTDPEGVSGVNSSDSLKDSIEDLDTAIGALRDELTTLGVRDNTMLWMTSDNGPEDGIDSPSESSTVRSIRSGRFLERKRSLHEGGLRVPGILEWPAMIPSGMVSDFPAVTSDYYPTILDYLCLSVPDQKPLDGVSLRPVIEGDNPSRTKPIGFKINDDNSWVGDQYKLIEDNGTWELYDLVNIAPGEEAEQSPLATSANIGSQPLAIQEVYNTMLAEFNTWDASLNTDVPYVHSSQPTVSLSTPSNNVAAPFLVTATFNESVSQLEANEITVENGVTSSLTGSGTSWSFTVTPSFNGLVNIHLPEGAVIDGDGNINASSNALSVTASGFADGIGTTLTTSSTEVTEPFLVTIDFDEAVTGLELSDFIVTNGNVNNLTGSGSQFIVETTPSSAGAVTVQLAAGSVTGSTSGDPNASSNILSVNFTAPPSTILTLTNGDLNMEVTAAAGTGSGANPYSYDPLTDSVTYDGNDTGLVAGEWVLPTLTRGFRYDSAGGAGGAGDGAMVQTDSGAFNQKPRAVFYVSDDNQTSTGELQLELDVFFDDNSTDNALSYLLRTTLISGRVSKLLRTTLISGRVSKLTSGDFGWISTL